MGIEKKNERSGGRGETYTIDIFDFFDWNQLSGITIFFGQFAQ